MIARRDLLGLAAAASGAVMLGAWLRRGMAVGENVGDRIDVTAMANAPGFPSEGSADAAITMLVFSDYACGICRQVEPWWREAVRIAGDVRVVHRDWPVLGPQSLRAARLALAAARHGRYLPAHDALMRSPGLSEPALREAMSRAGAEWGKLESDLAAHRGEIDNLLARSATDAMRLGFAGTPGFLIGSIRVQGGASERQFADAIARARQPG